MRYSFVQIIVPLWGPNGGVSQLFAAAMNLGRPAVLLADLGAWPEAGSGLSDQSLTTLSIGLPFARARRRRGGVLRGIRRVVLWRRRHRMAPSGVT